MLSNPVLENLDFVWFIAGLGLFLYGMMQLEAAIKTLSSHSFRRFLRRFTTNPVGAILSGTFITMIVQSSSMVGLMVLALVGAGVIPLFNAIGVVMGANLGTTFTGWIVTTLGFKLKIAAFAVPMMGIGALISVIFSRSERGSAWGKLVLGLGLLLFGLDGMKESIQQVAELLDPQLLQGNPLIIYVFFGIGFTILIQSSSATMMITLSALHAGMVDLPSAAAVVIGADLGTTSTIALGSFKGSQVKKQVAVAHVLFNMTAGIVAFTFLDHILHMIRQSFSITDPLYSLVAFHSVINTIGILIFLPFLKQFARLLEKYLSSNDDEVCEYINNVPPKMAEDALIAVAKETKRIILQAFDLNLRNLKLDPRLMRLPQSLIDQLSHVFPQRLSFNERYEAIKKLEGEILEYAGEIQKHELTTEQAKRLHDLLGSVRHAVYAVKSLKDVRENLVAFRHSDSPVLMEFFQTLMGPERRFYADFYPLLIGEHDKDFMVEELGKLIDKNKSHHKQFEKELFGRGLSEGIDEMEASTLLNVNRELRASNENLLKALEYQCK